MNRPLNKKNNVQNNPNNEQYFSVLYVRCFTLAKLPIDVYFEIIGRSIFATAQVMVVGNNIKGIAMAVSIP